MGHDAYDRGCGANGEDNTSPNVKTPREKHTESGEDSPNRTGRGDVTLEPCLRLLKRVLTRPGEPLD